MLETELRRAMAESLGRAGERLEQAIVRYRTVKREALASSDASAHQRLETARREVIQAREWLIIQREAIGLRRHECVDETFPLPFEMPSE